MLTLCINTAGHLNTVAIVKDGKCLDEENWESQKNETETVLKKIEAILKKGNVKIEEIEALNVVQGIGGFTSLRVGISIANTIAHVQKIPIYATSVFELWAKRIKHPPTTLEGGFAVLIDAGRQECFCFTSPLRGRLREVLKKPLDKLEKGTKSQNGANCLDTPPNLPLRGGTDQNIFYSPQIIQNSELSELKEKFWVGEINEKQKGLLKSGVEFIEELKNPSEAFAEMNLENRKSFKVLEPWYGREPNISMPKK